MLSSVFKKLNLCPFMPASRGVNPLATSRTVEHLSSICLHSWSHDKLNLYLNYHCLNRHCLEPLITINKNVFLNAAKKYLTSDFILEMTLQDVN